MKFFLGFISLVFTSHTYAWTITQFHSNIQLNTDGSANITETIDGDFSDDLSKHGIFRYIPVESKTDNGKINYTPISQIWITDKKGNNRPFQQSNKNKNIFLKIGDPNKTVSPKETYIIEYKIDRVPKSFPENNFDEFYWNVTGDKWDTVIEKILVTISLPTQSNINKQTCFTGIYGSKNQDCTYEMSKDGKAIFQTTTPINPGEGFTVDYGFDKGIVQTFDFKQESWWKTFFDKIGIWVVGIFSTLVLIIPNFYAWKMKKKLEINKPIIPKYEPPKGLHPTLIGTVIDGKFGKDDFTAGIIDLATHGLLEIEKKQVKGLLLSSEEYFLKRGDVVNPFIRENIRKIFYHLLFEQTLLEKDISGESGVFPYRHKTEMYAVFLKIQFQAIQPKYFKTDNGTTIFYFVLFAILVISFYLIGISLVFLFITGSTMTSLGIFSITSPKRSQAGFDLAHEAKCYKEFLKTAELDKLNWAEKQEIFEKNLPYAVAFGLTEKWTKIFGDTIKVPVWMHTGSINNLFKDIGDITSDISSNIQAPRSSSGGSGFGGGSSGGGSGGGGGGSW